MSIKILFNILCISLCMLLVVAQNGNYKVNVRRLNTISNPLPSINSQLSGDSVMKYNYNCAYVPIYARNTTLETPSLIVRTQNQANQSEQYSTTPSKLVFATMRQDNFEGEISFTSITENSIVFEPNSTLDNFGTEDPRVVYNPEDQLYYMTYSAVQSYENGTVISRLALATTHTPWLKNSWARRGVLFPQLSWSKSGSILLRKTGKNYMIFGDSSLVPGVQLAVSNDLLRWDLQPGIFIQTRNNSFDSFLIEGGPPPVLLSNGNYFYIYNSARAGYPSPKPGYDLQYNLGFVILDGNDPTKIIFRSEQPILSPESAWEKGSSPFLGLTPNVVFCSAMSTSQKADTFHIYYGAADSVVGVAEVTVSF